MPRRLIVLGAVLLHLCSPVFAQNLIVNPTFDTDVVSWDVPDGFGFILRHDPTDGSAAAGAAEVEGAAPGGPFSPFVIVQQCVDLGPIAGKPLTLMAEIKPVDHQPSLARLAVTYWGTAGCVDPFIDSASVEGAATLGIWNPVAGDLPTPPPGAVSALILIGVDTPVADPTLLTRFDDVFVGPVAEIFGDGFESGDTSGWE